MTRAILLVLDSVGIGSAPDAARFGDDGADTVGHIAEMCARSIGDGPGRRGPLKLPKLVGLGLGEACRTASGRVPSGLETEALPSGRFGCAVEVSSGKDTPSGHWEMAGAPVSFEWGYFPKTRPCFPESLIRDLCDRTDLPGILGNTHASGTEIIFAFGEEHLRTGKPICYTSADSVFQIAAHEEAFGLERLYAVCTVARELVDPLCIGRVIARPFEGASSTNFKRTANRHDYAVPPPGPTLLTQALSNGRDVVSVGKIDDIFAHYGTGHVMKGTGNAALFDRTLEGLSSLADGGLLFTNFVDFDTEYGHRRDVSGYAAALEAFDSRLPELYAALRPGDLVIITADHGCDPTWAGTDHTREIVPILAFGPLLQPGPIGRRDTFADIAATVLRHLDLPPLAVGRSF